LNSKKRERDTRVQSVSQVFHSLWKRSPLSEVSDNNKQPDIMTDIVMLMTEINCCHIQYNITKTDRLIVPCTSL